MAAAIIACIVEEFWRVNYSTDTNSRIKSHGIKHLLSDTLLRPEAVADNNIAYVYF